MLYLETLHIVSVMEQNNNEKLSQEARRLLEYAYYHFNKRNLDRLFLVIDPSVKWANGVGGGYVHGHQELRNYWATQWTEIDPQVKPLEFAGTDDGAILVQVHQLVKDKSGNVIEDSEVLHCYQLEDMKIKSMDIKKSR